MTWLQDSDGDGRYGLVLAATDGSGLRALSPEDVDPSWPNQLTLGPKWSHDGTLVAIAREGGDGGSSVAIYSADGTLIRELQSVPAEITVWMEWSADDRYIGVDVTEMPFPGYDGTVYVGSVASGELTKLDTGPSPVGDAGQLPVVATPRWLSSEARLVVAFGEVPEEGGYVPWGLWEPGSSGLTPVPVGGCTTYWTPPIGLPRSNGSAFGLVAGQLDCPEIDGEGLYLFDIAIDRD